MTGFALMFGIPFVPLTGCVQVGEILKSSEKYLIICVEILNGWRNDVGIGGAASSVFCSLYS